MVNKVLDSIVEITSQRDSNTLGISVLATMAEVLPSCYIVLYQYVAYPKVSLKVIHTITTETVNEQKDYKWGDRDAECDRKYILDMIGLDAKESIYETKGGRKHLLIPIVQDNKLAYAIDVSSNGEIIPYVDTLTNIGKVYKNFYAVLTISERDTLTGLLNRRTYESKLATLLSTQYSRQRANLTRPGNNRNPLDIDYTWLAVIDIDHFKKVNDKYGHIYGDEVLLTLSQLMKKNFRDNDLLFRFGGEEFVLIFEPVNKNIATKKLHSFMDAVRKYNFPMVGKVTVSVGFAKISSTQHPTTVLDNADKALYFAKENGRDCLFCYEDLIAEGKLSANKEEGDIELF